MSPSERLIIPRGGTENVRLGEWHSTKIDTRRGAVLFIL